MGQKGLISWRRGIGPAWREPESKRVPRPSLNRCPGSRTLGAHVVHRLRVQGSWADSEMPSATAAPSSTCSQSLPLEGPALLPEGMELETQEDQGRRE